MVQKNFRQIGLAFFMVVALLIAAPSSVVQAVSSGLTYPTVTVDAADVGTVAWTNPANALTNNNTDATVTLISGAISHYLKTTGYGFAIPTDATIKGIQLTIERYSPGTGGDPRIRDSVVSLVKAGTITGNNKANATTNWSRTTRETINYGSASDLWGATWTPGEINDPNFGAALAVTTPNSSSRTASVDYLAITVTYTRGTTTTVDCGGGTPVVLLGESITCVASVTRSAGASTPAGTVNWTTDATGTFTPPSCTLAGAGDTATCSVSYAPTALGDGSHQIQATYAGNADSTSSYGTQDVTVNDNEPPAIDGGSAIALSVPENTTAVDDVDATDPEGKTMTYSIAGGVDSGKFTIVPSTGVLTFITTPDYENPTDANLDNIYRAIVQVTDGWSAPTQTIDVTITDVDEPPVITSNGGGSTTAVSVMENTTAVTTVVATDPESATIIYSISGGADSTKFNINSSSGALTFNTPPDYHAPTDVGLNNVYDVVVQASDGLLTDTQAIAVTVTEENQPPEITEGASTTVNMSEDGVPDAFSLTLHATDPEATTLTWTISAQAEHGTAGATGTGPSKAITYTPDANYNGSDSFTVMVTDGGGLSDTIIVYVEIAPIADIYYVDNTNPAASDSNPGTSPSAPLKTIYKGALKAFAGDTVNVLAGTYPETILLKVYEGRNGYPITFHAEDGVTITGSGSSTSGAAFYFEDNKYIVIDGFDVIGTAFKGIFITYSDHITITNNYIAEAGEPVVGYEHEGINLKDVTYSLIEGNVVCNNTSTGILLRDRSNNNVVSNNISYGNYNAVGEPTSAAGIQVNDSDYNTIIHNITYGNIDSGINLYISILGTGSKHNQVVGNLTYGNGDHGIDNNNSPYQIIVGNTVHGNVTSGINLEGNSTNATIENNIVMDNGLNPLVGKKGNIHIDSTSWSGIILDYNLYYRTGGTVQIAWNSTYYATLAAFKAANPTLEVHGVEGNPLFMDPAPVAVLPLVVQEGDYHLQALSPAIDSADSSAPSMPTTDIEGNPRVDIPTVDPNTGGGMFDYYDRGAYERQITTITKLYVTSITSTYGNTVDLTATLEPALENMEISFKLNGVAACSDTTNASGLATCKATLLTNVGTYEDEEGIVANFAGNSEYDPSSGTAALTVNKRNLTVTATGIDKVYDGTTAATVTLGDNRVAGDTLTVGYTSAAFDNENVGTGKTVNVSGISVSGEDAGNYTLTNTTAVTTANITKRELTVTAAAANKTYDGTTAAAVTLGDNRVEGDTLTVGYTSASFDTKNIGTGKTVTVSGISISGADAGNYTLTSNTALTTANITKRDLTLGAEGVDKPYDSTTAATVSFTDDRIPGDTLTINYTAAFVDKNVSTGKLINISGYSLSGADSGNYNLLNPPASTSADITKYNLTVTATGINKVYDGTTAATVTLAGWFPGDALNVTGTATFADANVGVDKVITVNGISISGADAGNYNLLNTTTTTSADITVRELTITANSGQHKSFGYPDPILTFTYSPDDVPAAFTGALSREPGEAIGSYAITLGTLEVDGENFTIKEFVPAQFNILELKYLYLPLITK